MSGPGAPYGQALYRLAREEGLEKSIGRQLSAIRDSFRREPDFLSLLSSPEVGKGEACRILDQVFRDLIHIYVLNTLKLLTKKGHIAAFSSCYDTYAALYRQEQGILTVTAVTALPLTRRQFVFLRKKMEGMTCRKVYLENHIDADVLGGVRLEWDGRCLDDTLANRMEQLRSVLTGSWDHQEGKNGTER